MKSVKVFLVVIISLWSFNLFLAEASGNSPSGAMKSTVDSILEILKGKELSGPAEKEEIRSKIGSLIRDRFDFREMAKRSLARHWKKRGAGEKDEFTAIFADLLEASYIGKVELYTNEKVVYNKEVIKGKGKYAVVSTTVVTKDVDIPIDYKLILKNGKWWVYDVVIEGVSFVSTYRSQYNKVILRESYAGLIRKLKKKLDEVNAI